MRPLRLSVQGQSRFKGLPARATVGRWLAAALARDAEVTLRFVGAVEGRRLNRRYRHKDYATNVLTFEYAQAPVILADIVLCVPVIRREAREQDKTLRDHLAHLIVHGALHAQGYAHDSTGRARRMEALEVRILARLGVADPYRGAAPRAPLGS